MTLTLAAPETVVPCRPQEGTENLAAFIRSCMEWRLRLKTHLKQRRAQPVDATPSDMNSFSKGGVYGTRKMGQAFHGAED
jgi:hypothetical protein